MIAAVAIVAGGASTAYAVGGGSGTAQAAAVRTAFAPGSAEDGRELFRAIFFGQGGTAKALAERDGELFSAVGDFYAENNTQEAIAGGTAVLDLLESDDAAYFASFSTELRSGAPERVEAALLASQEDLEALEIEKTEIDGGATCVYLVNVVAAVNVAGVANAAVVAAAANFVVAANWFWSAPAGGAEGLSQEAAIAQVTSALQL
ncbi:hypothetical protein [Streptomyces sp. PT12]|uniref:hypothetical protein n=1 Tax=Streptomyces sp. PT12 TaxID=1510197 RepID=UPI000E05B8E4|nr:hypothetical protein [Streptomyces sp. PT12]RBM16096.1 hypothetical protein DEH69_16970 [Streptomyces sp. PT12]